MNVNPAETWRSYATICRLCLQKDGFMLGIFNHIQGKDKSIYKKIIDCTALQISHGDGLPNVICHRCLFKIEFCLEFRQLCFMSDATLRQINGVINKENGSEPSNTSHLPLYEQLANGNDEDVVMVVDPSAYDYESDYESDKEIQSDNENGETNDIEHEGRGVSMCKFCDHAFTDSTECLNHEINTHNSETPYSCGTCYMSFADRLLFSAHLKSVHKNDKPYNCPQCDRTFARRSDLRKHTIVHTGVKPYTCNICYKSFSRNTNLSKHMRIHSGTKPFVCPKCPKTFTSKGDLTRHAIIHSGQKPFSCNYCHLSFGRRDKLLRHEKRHFPQENAEDKSQELQMMRENLSIYSTQNNEHNDEEKQEGSENMVITLDPFNHNNFSTGATPQRENNSETEHQNNENETVLSDHIKLEDLDADPKLYQQVPEHITGESFRGDLQESVPTAELKPYKCPQCPKRFSKIENLHVHENNHSGIRPFSCHICNKTFIRKRELDRHIATHSGMKPFKCPRCNKGFGRKDKLIRHMRIHDLNKNFNCTLCGSTFNRRDSLQQHMKTHAAHAVKEEEVENNSFT
ncbi:zinc finger protein 2 [Anoplophora glabripennis]|nr:zinc finger protein 2 [Anoplophora glabripennis]